MRKPWTVRLVAVTSGIPVAYVGDVPTFWTHRGAMERCRRANRSLRKTPLAIWLPVRNTRRPW